MEKDVKIFRKNIIACHEAIKKLCNKYFCEDCPLYAVDCDLLTKVYLQSDYLDEELQTHSFD